MLQETNLNGHVIIQICWIFIVSRIWHFLEWLVQICI